MSTEYYLYCRTHDAQMEDMCNRGDQVLLKIVQMWPQFRDIRSAFDVSIDVYEAGYGGHAAFAFLGEHDPDKGCDIVVRCEYHYGAPDQYPDIETRPKIEPTDEWIFIRDFRVDIHDPLFGTFADNIEVVITSTQKLNISLRSGTSSVLMFTLDKPIAAALFAQLGRYLSVDGWIISASKLGD